MSVLSALANLFAGKKKRHNSTPLSTRETANGRITGNTESIPTGLNQSPIGRGPLTRAEFLSVYESMPESARAQLFASLDFTQKARLLDLLSPEKSRADLPRAEEPRWSAEDFLPEKDERKVARLRQLTELRELKSIFAALEERDPHAVAEVLSAESALITAMALLQFSQKFASRVLRLMDELRRGEVVRFMATERQLSGEVLLALGKKLTQKVAELPTVTESRIDGVRHVNEILKLLGAEEADRITREVAQHDEKLAHTLESSRYRFEDLVSLNARDFRTLFSALPDEQLWARALKAIDQGQRKALLGKLPVKRAGLIAAAMNEIKTTRLDSIDKARNKILGEALKLAARSEIRFAGNGLH